MLFIGMKVLVDGQRLQASLHINNTLKKQTPANKTSNPNQRSDKTTIEQQYQLLIMKKDVFIY